MNPVYSKLWLWMALLTIPLSSNAAEHTWLDPSFVANAFVQVALRDEYSPGEKKLRKWQQPLRVYVVHQVADQALHNELLEMHLRHLSQITGRSITPTTTREEANVVWVFTQEAHYEREVARLLGKRSAANLGSAICKAGFKTEQSVIHYGAIVIPVDKAREHGKLVACIVEEITQVLGLPNDSQQAYPSIFNDNSPEELLSPLDVVLLQLLYQPDLKAGMSESEALPIIRQQLQRFQQQGTLDKAVTVATQGELFQLIGY